MKKTDEKWLRKISAERIGILKETEKKSADPCLFRGGGIAQKNSGFIKITKTREPLWGNVSPWNDIISENGPKNLGNCYASHFLSWVKTWCWHDSVQGAAYFDPKERIYTSKNKIKKIKKQTNKAAQTTVYPAVVGPVVTQEFGELCVKWPGKGECQFP